ncbi:MAG: Rhodanese-like domain protein [Labilithrix sp.]|nr:Rhodanese-like domain protein [Labilithrix sp.]
MTISFRAAVLALTTITLVAGCDDPSKGKAKATTGEAVSATAQASTAASTKYAFDQTSSKIQWVGSKVTGKHDGSFEKFTGSVDVVDGSPEKSKVTVDIDTTSIKADDEKLTGHLKTPDFFDVEKHPKATFVSTEIKKGGEKGASHTVTGNLTIKGISKSITFPATISVSGDSANVDAEFSINRRDYSINYAGKANDLIRDDVVLKLTIKGKKASS